MSDFDKWRTASEQLVCQIESANSERRSLSKQEWLLDLQQNILSHQYQKILVKLAGMDVSPISKEKRTATALPVFDQISIKEANEELKELSTTLYKMQAQFRSIGNNIRGLRFADEVYSQIEIPQIPHIPHVEVSTESPDELAKELSSIRQQKIHLTADIRSQSRKLIVLIRQSEKLKDQYSQLVQKAKQLAIDGKWRMAYENHLQSNKSVLSLNTKTIFTLF